MSDWIVSATGAPAFEPVDLALAKSHLRVTVSAEDALITHYAKTAREHIENLTGRAIAATSWRQTSPAFAESIEIAKAPVSQVTAVRYRDASGTLQTVSPSVYEVRLSGGDVSTSSPVSVVSLAPGQSWPHVGLFFDAVQVEFIAGYANAAAVPSSLQSAILLALGDLYANREAQSREKPFQDNPAVARLINPYVLAWV